MLLPKLREILSHKPSRKAFDELNQVIREKTHEKKSFLIDYVRLHLESWPTFLKHYKIDVDCDWEIEPSWVQSLELDFTLFEKNTSFSGEWYEKSPLFKDIRWLQVEAFSDLLIPSLQNWKKITALSLSHLRHEQLIFL